MGRDDMDHLRHLETVALSDCSVLESKEATYQGSWKRAGGRSAWFMARRNLDRLITMMSPKDFPEYVKTFENVRDTVRALDGSVHYNFPPSSNTVQPLPGTIEATRTILEMLLDSYTSEDIFMKIREKPKGEDGTVLACLRDARRYFMLVEAEMIAEGVVEPEIKTYEQNADPYLVVAEENGMDVAQLKEYLLDWKPPPSVTIEKASPAPQPLSSAANGGYAVEQAARHTEEWNGGVRTQWVDRIGALLRIGDLATYDQGVGGIVVVEIAGAEEDYPVVKAPGVLPEEGVQVRDTKRLRRQLPPRAETVADGGSQHAAQNPLWPWNATASEFDALVTRTGATTATAFYTRRAANVYQLEPVALSQHCPKELYPAYEFVEGSVWALRRALVPSEIDENFPRLQREMNSKEYEDSSAVYQFMYRYDESDQKWKLQDRWLAWGREAA